MILAVDIGNTNMEFGVFDGGVVRAKFRLVTDRNVTSDEIGLMMTQFFRCQNIRGDQIDDVIIASVVPQVMFSISNAMKKYLSKVPMIVGENCPIPVENHYANPKEVGADRLVNAYAAHRHYSGDLIVVDFGTATTFDVVSAAGAYEGGCIAPGIKISMEALTNTTAKLPRVEIVSPGTAIGKDTITSMQAGAVCGFVGATGYTISYIKKELGKPAFVVATGGLSSLIASHTGEIDVVDKQLTLQGLYDIYHDARQAKK